MRRARCGPNADNTEAVNFDIRWCSDDNDEDVEDDDDVEDGNYIVYSRGPLSNKAILRGLVVASRARWLGTVRGVLAKWS